MIRYKVATYHEIITKLQSAENYGLSDEEGLKLLNPLELFIYDNCPEAIDEYKNFESQLINLLEYVIEDVSQDIINLFIEEKSNVRN